MTTVVMVVMSTLVGALLIWLLHLGSAPRAEQRSPAHPTADQQQAAAEAALLHALAEDRLTGLKSAITDHGLAAGTSSVALRQARQRRNELSEIQRQQQRAQRIAARKGERKTQVLAPVAEQQQGVHPIEDPGAAAESSHFLARRLFGRFMNLVAATNEFVQAGKQRALARAEDEQAAEAEAAASAAAAAAAAKAPAPAPTAWASIARARGPQPTVTPLMAQFEAAARAALSSRGTHGIGGFRRDMQRLKGASGQTVTTMRIAAMRIAAEQLSGAVARDASLIHTTLCALIGLLHSTFLEPIPSSREALFFPSDASKARLLQILGSATVSCDVCVYTITDDAIRDALLALHRRGVQVALAP